MAIHLLPKQATRVRFPPLAPMCYDLVNMKNNQKGFSALLLIVIIAVLVMGAGVYVYENKKSEAPAVVDTGTQPSNQQPSSNDNQSTEQISASPVSPIFDSNYILIKGKDGHYTEKTDNIRPVARKFPTVLHFENVPTEVGIEITAGLEMGDTYNCDSKIPCLGKFITIDATGALAPNKSFPVEVTYVLDNRSVTEKFTIQTVESTSTDEYQSDDLTSLVENEPLSLKYFDNACKRQTDIPDRIPKSVIKHLCSGSIGDSNGVDYSPHVRYQYTQEGSYQSVQTPVGKISFNLGRGDTVYESQSGSLIQLSSVGLENCGKDGCFSRYLDFATTTAQNFEEFVKKITTNDRAEKEANGDPTPINFITRKIGGYDILMGYGYEGPVVDDWDNLYIYAGDGYYFTVFSPLFDVRSVRRIK